MPIIINSPDDLKDPFLCFCVFRKFCQESEEDYIDYNESIINAYPFSMWLFGKGYIKNETIEKFCAKNGLSIQDVLKDDIMFPNTYGNSDISDAKAYSLLAEYISAISEFRKRLYDSVNNKATGFINSEFYKDDNGISLACIIDDEDIRENGINKELLLQKDSLYGVSLRDIYNSVISMSVGEADIDFED